MTININETVIAKLTPAGDEIAVKNGLRRYTDGEARYMHEQLWKVMQAFGPSIGLGMGAFFADNHIIIACDREPIHWRRL